MSATISISSQLFRISFQNICSAVLCRSVSKCANLSVLLSGLKPQSIQEEDFFAKQQLLLMDKLKKNGFPRKVAGPELSSNNSNFIDKEAVCAADSVCRHFLTTKIPLNCRENAYFYQESLEAIKALKNCNPQDNDTEKS